MEQVDQVEQFEMFEDYDLESDPEWIKYCADVEEYNDEPEEYSEYDYSWVPQTLPAPVQVDGNEHDESEYIVLGKIQVPKSKVKKSFKYTTKDHKIFCPSLVNRGKKTVKCSEVKCKYVHNFTDITFCTGSCGRIEQNNNYYTGNCFKRHSGETIDNYVLRKSIRLAAIQSVTLEMFERPDAKFIAEVLETAKKLHLHEINIVMVKPKRTLAEYYESL